MHSWTDTELYPVVKVTRNYKAGTAKISQISATEFFDLQVKKSNHKWWIPICYTTQSKLNFNITSPIHWLKPQKDELIIEGLKTNDWLILNNQQSGKKLN